MSATALSPHPCGSTHCASSAFGLHPSRDFVVSGLFVYEDQKQIKGFPAEAGPTGIAAGPTDTAHAFSGTGFNREAFDLIVPTLRVVMPPRTLCVTPFIF